MPPRIENATWCASPLLEGVRNDLEERRAEQRADREGHQHRHPGRAQLERDGGEAGGQRSAGDARGENPGKRHGGVDST